MRRRPPERVLDAVERLRAATSRAKREAAE